jgi:hypothetical protein
MEMRTTKGRGPHQEIKTSRETNKKETLETGWTRLERNNNHTPKHRSVYTSNPEHTIKLDGPGQSGIETTHKKHRSLYTSNPEHTKKLGKRTIDCMELTPKKTLPRASEPTKKYQKRNEPGLSDIHTPQRE